MKPLTPVTEPLDPTLLQASDRYGGFAVARNVVPLFALLALAPVLAARSMALAWALAPLIGLFLYRNTIVMHDCIHGTLFRRPGVNQAVGRLLSAVTGIDLRRFTEQHWKHHRIYGEAEDPQGFHYLGVQHLSRLQYVWHLLKPLLGANLRYTLPESLLHPGNLGPALRRGDALIAVVVQLAILLVVTRGGRYPSLALLPVFSAGTFGLFFSQLRGLAEHGARAAFVQAGLVRSHRVRALERMFLYDLHFNYHTAHHRWPHCPSRHLPAVHERYLEARSPLEPGMFATLIAIGGRTRA